MVESSLRLKRCKLGCQGYFPLAPQGLKKGVDSLMSVNAKGFTLIEMIMVVVMLGFLGMVAVPIYTDLTSRARTAGEDGVVGAIRSAIAVYHAVQTTPNYPATLDPILASGNCSTGCFRTVLGQGGIRDATWTKGTTTTTYLYDPDGAGSATASTYTYTQGTASDGGKFLKT